MKTRLSLFLIAVFLVFSLCACGMESTGPAPTPTPTPVYSVVFDKNGGTLLSGKLLQRVEAGRSAEAPVLEREGYVQTGWNESLDSVSEDMIISALWSPVYTIRFDPAGGSISSGEAVQTVPKGDYPEPPEFERAYYRFEGWDPDPTKAEADAVYTAVWTALRLSSEEVFDKIAPSVVEITAYEPSGVYSSLGSGFFIDSSGTVVTNFHVIDGCVSGEIALKDGSTHSILSVLFYDEILDLAVLRTDVQDNPFLNISETVVTTGETVYALGSSQGLTNTFSSGIVSSASRDLEGVNCIQTTAPISEGNSGGPLVNAYGDVVGVNSMTLLSGQNLNFAVDIHELEKLTEPVELSLQELYDVIYSSEADTAGDKEGFYSDAVSVEAESNDSILLSDPLENGVWLAAEITDLNDIDWFCLEITQPCDVSFEVAPYYTVDNDYLVCGVLALSEDDLEVLDVLVPSTTGYYDVSNSGTVHFEDSGIYFLMICAEDSYQYSEPIYYTVNVTW